MSEPGFCTQCGSAMAATDAFCRRCGAARFGGSTASAGGNSAPQNPSAPRNFGTAPTASKPAALPVALALLLGGAVLAVAVWIGAGYFSSQRYSSANLMDRNAELQANCGPFTRVYAAGATFAQLCDQLHMKCGYVCDWEGHMKPCGSSAHDGSRVVSSQPVGANNGIGMPPARLISWPAPQPIQDNSEYFSGSPTMAQ